MISIDTETTGVDLFHGARPFFVTSASEDGTITSWEWDVDPMTREPQIPDEDLEEIGRLLQPGYGFLQRQVVGQNIKFDVHALAAIGIEEWPWEQTDDTLIAGHLLASNLPHDLTSMAMQYLGVDIKPLEDELEVAVKEARRMAKSKFPDWQTARKGLAGMPSAGEKTWRFDYWLPRALARELGYKDDHPWHGVLARYSNADSETTLALWLAMREELKRRDLWEIYRERMRAIPVAWEMESHGITMSRSRQVQMDARCEAEAKEASDVCSELAGTVPCPGCPTARSLFPIVCRTCKGRGRVPKLPELPAGMTNVLREVLFDDLKLPAVQLSDKTGEPSVNKQVLDDWIASEPKGSAGRAFAMSLRDFRKRTTARTYLRGYLDYALPSEHGDDWLVLHPSLNPTGTDTLRWSSNHPNEQNISKQEGFNLRWVFGPAPGREWWSLDAKNIELRIPAFEAGEQALMDVFLRPKEPPYFGSYHLVIFDLLHPDLFAKHGQACKTVYESTWYQWVKNGNFAVIYGAQDETADRSYRVPGARRRIMSKLKRIAALSEEMMRRAERDGLVETMPDRSVNPRKGYPILCTRTEFGRVLPTVPLNYHVQSTACWWMMRAMTRCHALLKRWRDEDGYDGHIVMQVHDELVFDLPAGDNEARVRLLAAEMERGGDDIGVPTPVDMERHESNWSEGVKIAA